MGIDPQRLLSHQFGELRQSYDARDAILYALGLGLGRDPLDEDDLSYLLETRLSVLPAFAGTLASPGMWIRDPAFGIDFAKLVHAEQEAHFHAPLPTSGSVAATPRVASLHDRGPGKGAVLVVERGIDDAATGQRYATIKQTLLLRGDGGFGGEPPSGSEIVTMPERSADHIASWPVSLRAALIYRLSGDWNPLHADPAAAKAAGFARPILHGLASYGIASRVVEQAAKAPLCGLACRFAGVVLPGDDLVFSLWQEGSTWLFEAFVGSRKVLDRGRATLSR